MASFNVSVDLLREKVAQCAALDNRIASASGSEAAIKRDVAVEVADETKDSWSETVDYVTNVLSEVEDISVLAGSYTAIIRSIREKFHSQVDAYLTEAAKARAENLPKVPEAELEQLIAQRKEISDQEKILRQMLEAFGEDVSSVPAPKKMSGARGKRGPRIFTGYIFSVDGKERTSSQNSLSSIANTVCKDIENGSWKVQQLREFIAASGVSLEDPPERWEVTLPNGKVVSAFKKANDEGDDDDVESDSDNEPEEDDDDI